MSVTINGTSGLVFNDASTQTTAATGFGFKNRIINGAMVIDQRNAGASVTQTTAYNYIVDRWSSIGSVTSKFTSQQNAGSVTPPIGYINYLGNTSSAATTVGASDYYVISQKIEGLNVADLAWGTANAATITLSFWVRSSLTGTFSGGIQNSAISRGYPFTYTISSANTWEQKTVTIAGDTTGTWLTTNGVGLTLSFSLGVGSTYSATANAWTAGNIFNATGATSVVGTNGATFYITGVQLEKGSTATSFDYRPYGTEEALCQRYYQTSYTGVGVAVPTNSTGGYVPIPSALVANGIQYAYIPFKQQMRVAPTTTTYSYTSSTTSVASTLGGTDLAASSAVPTGANTNHFWLNNNSGASITPALGGFLIHFAATAEL